MNHSFKRGKEGSNTSYDALDILPFVLQYKGRSSVGNLGPFEVNFLEDFYHCHPDRYFIVDPCFFCFSTPNEASEVVVCAGHLNWEV